MDDEANSTTLSLTTGGITLLGVLLSIGVTVALGLNGPWWLRAAIGLATTGLLIVAVKVGTDSGRGPLSRFARWTIGYRTGRDGGRSRRDAGGQRRDSAPGG